MYIADKGSKKLKTLVISTGVVATHVALDSSSSVVTGMSLTCPTVADPLLVKENGVIPGATPAILTTYNTNCAFSGTSTKDIVYHFKNLFVATDGNTVVILNAVTGDYSNVCTGTATNTDATAALCTINAPTSLYYSARFLYIASTTKIHKLTGKCKYIWH